MPILYIQQVTFLVQQIVLYLTEHSANNIVFDWTYSGDIGEKTIFEWENKAKGREAEL